MDRQKLSFVLIDRERSSYRQNQKTAKKDYRSEVAVEHQGSKGPKSDAPEERMPCNPLDTLRRLLLSQQSSAPHGGWVRRGERENNEEKSDQHHDQGDWPKRLRLSPELEVFSLSVGPRQPDNPNQRHQREQALERSLADQADNLTAKRGAGNKKVNAVKK